MRKLQAGIGRSGLWALIGECALLLGLAAITALTVNHFSPRGIALVGDWDPSLGVITARERNDVVVHDREIRDIAEAKAVFDAQEALFIDVRHFTDFNRGHIQGALSFPVNEMEQWIDGFIGRYPVSRLIVVYCYGRECEDSHIVAQFLDDMGYERVRVLVDGYGVWKAKGFPVE